VKPKVVITGMGTVNPLSLNVEETWNLAVSGKSGIGKITHFKPDQHSTKFAGEVNEFDAPSRFGRKTARHMDRFVQFAVAATEEALQDANLDVTESNRDRIGVIIGTGIGGVSTLEKQTETLRKSGPKRVSPFMVPMMLPDTAAGQVAISFGARGPNLCITSACASSTNALGEAAEIIKRGSADVVIAGGAEAAITPVTIAAFANMGALSSRNDDPHSACRPFDKDRDGFVAGEGAAILLLESEQHALERGAKIYAEIAGYGLSNDAHHITAPASDGASAIISMQLAIHNSNLKPEDINYINAHGTSTLLNDKTETLAIKKVFGNHAYNIPISSTKSMHGHLLGAAGALEAIMCIKSLMHKTIPPTINQFTSDPDCDLDYVANKSRELTTNAVMSNSFGFGGHNASLIFTKYIHNKLSFVNA
jgi:3-oxoacyl-[acyl-carrier-protein] synthase II